MARFNLVVGCCGWIGMVSSGCWVKEEAGKRMQTDIAALQVEFEVVKQAHALQKADLKKRLVEADDRIGELIKIIEDYRRAMGRNAADVGVDLENIRTQLMELRGRMEVFEHRLEKIWEKFSTAPAADGLPSNKPGIPIVVNPPSPQPPPDPLAAIKRPDKKEDFYKLAYGLLEAGQYDASRKLFQEFLDKWPNDVYSDNALYWMGESYYAEKKYRQAALTFQKVRAQFPKGDKASDALLKLGYSFFAMERYKEAIPFLGEFVQSFPKSSQVEQAKKKIAEAKRKMKN